MPHFALGRPDAVFDLSKQRRFDPDATVSDLLAIRLRLPDQPFITGEVRAMKLFVAAMGASNYRNSMPLLVDRETAERDTKRLTTRLKFAALRQSACVEDIDWRTPRGIDRAVFARLEPRLQILR